MCWLLVRSPGYRPGCGLSTGDGILLAPSARGVPICIADAGSTQRPVHKPAPRSPAPGTGRASTTGGASQRRRKAPGTARHRCGTDSGPDGPLGEHPDAGRPDERCRAGRRRRAARRSTGRSVGQLGRVSDVPAHPHSPCWASFRTGLRRTSTLRPISHSRAFSGRFAGNGRLSFASCHASPSSCPPCPASSYSSCPAAGFREPWARSGAAAGPPSACYL